MEQVSKLEVRWKIDPSHSFCKLTEYDYRLHFRMYCYYDEDSEIPLSVFLHNSYDQSEGVRINYSTRGGWS
jgi:predicted peptidase